MMTSAKCDTELTRGTLAGWSRTTPTATITLWTSHEYSALLMLNKYRCMIYSFFEKRCLRKPYATIPKCIMGNGFHGP